MGLVRITSWYPNFNGSHFGLPPSSIHRMTGLGGNFVCAQAPLSAQGNRGASHSARALWPQHEPPDTNRSCQRHITFTCPTTHSQQGTDSKKEWTCHCTCAEVGLKPRTCHLFEPSILLTLVDQCGWYCHCFVLHLLSSVCLCLKKVSAFLHLSSPLPPGCCTPPQHPMPYTRWSRPPPTRRTTHELPCYSGKHTRRYHSRSANPIVLGQAGS